jgi:hypothetical protein
MRRIVTIEHIGLLGSIMEKPENQNMILVTDSQDTKPIADYIGHVNNNEWDIDTLSCSYFVSIDDGEYTKIYAFLGNVPFLYKPLYQINIKMEVK